MAFVTLPSRIRDQRGIRGIDVGGRVAEFRDRHRWGQAPERRAERLLDLVSFRGLGSGAVPRLTLGSSKSAVSSLSRPVRMAAPSTSFWQLADIARLAVRRQRERSEAGAVREPQEDHAAPAEAV